MTPRVEIEHPRSGLQHWDRTLLENVQWWPAGWQGSQRGAPPAELVGNLPLKCPRKLLWGSAMLQTLPETHLKRCQGKCSQEDISLHWKALWGRVGGSFWHGVPLAITPWEPGNGEVSCSVVSGCRKAVCAAGTGQWKNHGLTREAHHSRGRNLFFFPVSIQHLLLTKHCANWLRHTICRVHLHYHGADSEG